VEGRLKLGTLVLFLLSLFVIDEEGIEDGKTSSSTELP
jgi:hypothetical protein